MGWECGMLCEMGEKTLRIEWSLGWEMGRSFGRIGGLGISP